MVHATQHNADEEYEGRHTLSITGTEVTKVGVCEKGHVHSVLYLFFSTLFKRDKK